MDELERLVRAANPSPVRRTSTLSPRSESDLAQIVSAPRASARADQGWRRTVIWGSAVAAGLAIILTVTAQLTAPRATASPPVLAYASVAGSAASALERLGELARKNITTPSSDVLVSETWSADITIGVAETTTYVQPREVTRTFRSDGTATFVVRAGTVRWGVVSGDDEAPAAGTELERMELTAADGPRLFVEPPPSAGPEFRTYLESTLGLSEASTTGDYFAAVQSLRDEWAFDGEQTAALTELVASLPDVTMLGETTDRLGRAGIAFATRTNGDGTFQTVLIFDRASGALIAFENTYLGGNPDVALPSPSVVNYIAWKDQP